MRLHGMLWFRLQTPKFVRPGLEESLQESISSTVGVDPRSDLDGFLLENGSFWNSHKMAEMHISNVMLLCINGIASKNRSLAFEVDKWRWF